MRGNLRVREVPEVVGHDRARSAYNRGSYNVFVVGIGQPEGTVVWLPIFDQGVVKRCCHLVNQALRARGRNIGLFASVDQLVCLVVFQFGQNDA